jgi:azurin
MGVAILYTSPLTFSRLRYYGGSMKTLFLTAIVILALATLTNCTKSNNEAGDAAGVAAANGPESNINIGSVGETMAFDRTELTVKSGEQITLNFKNNSSTLQHNWVLVKPGTENDVGLAGIKAGMSKGFIPDDPAVAADVLAHTKLVDPGKTDTVTFKAPAAGDYPYICTNAGHHTVMKGVLHSK